MAPLYLEARSPTNKALKEPHLVKKPRKPLGRMDLRRILDWSILVVASASGNHASSIDFTSGNLSLRDLLLRVNNTRNRASACKTMSVQEIPLKYAARNNPFAGGD
jgi:hypothetical protein